MCAFFYAPAIDEISLTGCFNRTPTICPRPRKRVRSVSWTFQSEAHQSLTSSPSPLSSIGPHFGNLHPIQVPTSAAQGTMTRVFAKISMSTMCPTFVSGVYVRHTMCFADANAGCRLKNPTRLLAMWSKSSFLIARECLRVSTTYSLTFCVGNLEGVLVSSRMVL
jgi:hypothetical protein